ncbi:MAG: dTDP-4-dehydrorhamnose reductase [Candidatus Aminicenantes bacterium]|nr:dTDP-4-dehydrorhamnose reductase [Candidatus Aminicenantes bacterium]
MKIAIIGADGQLGSDLVRRLTGDALLPLYYPAFDVTRPDEARSTLAAWGPECVINTAAFHRVDECEIHPDKTFAVNATAVRDLAAICREIGCPLVHFSTDYVFDGAKGSPYVEEDAPNPLSVYAVSKLAGEILLRNGWERHFLVRTCGLYGESGCLEKGMNFADRVLDLARHRAPLRVVDDQRVTPTSTRELAAGVDALIRTSAYGLYHLTNEGDCTWYEFARAVLDLSGLEADLRPVSTRRFAARARRPAYSVLENKRAKALGLAPFSPWTEALRAYLAGKGILKAGTDRPIR